MSGELPPAVVLTLKCGHEARLRSRLPAGAYITCIVSPCQGQRRIMAVRPDAVAAGPDQLSLFGNPGAA